MRRPPPSRTVIVLLGTLGTLMVVASAVYFAVPHGSAFAGLASAAVGVGLLMVALGCQIERRRASRLK